MPEVDHLLRARVGGHAARLFRDALASGTHTVTYLTPRLLRRAVAIDSQFAAVSLGFVDSCVLAIAERRDVPVLTFDLEGVRATAPAAGSWRLIIDEERYHTTVRRS